MILLYRLLFLPALVLALPYYLLRMWRRGGYRKDFKHRLGRFAKLGPAAEGKTRIWLQAVSVGEVLAVAPLIRQLQESGRIEIVLTTTTSTAYVEARKRYADTVHRIGIFPLDFWLFSRLAWKRIQPDVIILTESELWPEHLHRAKQTGTPAYLVNARMSDRSFRRYQKIAGLACRLLEKFRVIFVASEYDAARLVKLGVSTDRIQSYGSLKFDVPLPNTLDADALENLRKELGFQAEADEPPFVLLGSSTWPDEEALLIEITKRIRATGVDLRLLLVPRHAERGPELRRILEQQDLVWQQRSHQKEAEGEVIIYLADTTGELSRLTQVADLAFIGKSLPPNEAGQTPIEAAGLGIPTLMGPGMSNFKVVSKSLVEAGAAKMVRDGAGLEEEVQALLNDPDARKTMSTAGREWHERNRGSSARIAETLLNEIS